MAMARALMFFLLAVSGACSTPVKEPSRAEELQPLTSIYLVSHGWHVGIVLKRADIPQGLWRSQRDFPDVEYLEVGWGDRDFYQTPNPHLGGALKAGLLPTASVLHIVGFSGSVPASFPYSEIIEIELPGSALQRLARYIAASHSRDDAGNTGSLGPDLYRSRRFYPSRDTYHLFNTCNVWSAKALRSAGLPIAPAQAMTAEGLMSQARKIGKQVQSAPDSSHR